MAAGRLYPEIPRGHTWSESYRLECEARTVMGWSRDERLGYYRRIAERRGKAAARLLVEKVRELGADELAIRREGLIEP